MVLQKLCDGIEPSEIQHLSAEGRIDAYRAEESLYIIDREQVSQSSSDHLSTHPVHSAHDGKEVVLICCEARPVQE